MHHNQKSTSHHTAIGSAGSKSVAKSASMNYIGGHQPDNGQGSGIIMGAPPY